MTFPPILGSQESNERNTSKPWMKQLQSTYIEIIQGIGYLHAKFHLCIASASSANSEILNTICDFSTHGDAAVLSCQARVQTNFAIRTNRKNHEFWAGANSKMLLFARFRVFSISPLKLHSL